MGTSSPFIREGRALGAFPLLPEAQSTGSHVKAAAGC